MPEEAAPPLLNLTNQFLVAMPGMSDPHFARSVVYICEHSDKGALGLVVNKPAPVTLAELLEQLGLPLRNAAQSERPIYQGGPVQTERGFVLHEPMRAAELPADEAAYASTLIVPGGLEMTVSRDVLEAVALGGGPRRLMVLLGYASWEGGQLEAELSDNQWLTTPASPDIIFHTPAEQRYDQALGLLGLSAGRIALRAGHA